MAGVSGPFLPTPETLLRSKRLMPMPGMFPPESDYTGSSTTSRSTATAGALHLPPTPPVHDMLDASGAVTFDTGRGSGRSFESPPEDTRLRVAKVDMTRRPHSTYPTEDPVYHPHRKYTDPTPHPTYYSLHEPSSPNLSGSGHGHHLDVDLDVYSQEYDDDEIRQPTLSFVTTSTADSTTSSPSINEAYTYGTERIDGKAEQLHEPMIRVRTNVGRQHAYSSAESSTASGAYSYHAYSDNLYSAPPPLVPTTVSSDIGLGISRSNQYLDRSSAGHESQPGASLSVYDQDWHNNMTRDRSHSNASALSTDSSSTDDRLSTSFQHTFSYLSDPLSGDRHSWDDDPNGVPESNALAMVGDGRSIILDREKLEAMGGIRTLRKMSDNDLLRLPRFTHLLLSSVGCGVLDILPALLDVLSTTLVVLDVSNNDLTSLPAELRHCTALEELNVSGNPLRQIPAFLADCFTLHVLVADNCMLGSLPVELSQLSHLHTLCIRSNRMVSLPPWLCLLTHLETLRIDNNPFPPQWIPIVAPILASTLSQQTLRHKGSIQSMHSLMGSTISSSAASSIHHVAISPSQYTPISATSSTNHSDSFASASDSQSSLVNGSRTETSRPTTPGIQSLRTMRGSGTTVGKRSETPLPANNSRTAGRSVTGPAASTDIFASQRLSAGKGSRRIMSAAGHYTTDDSDHETQDIKAGGKWGFLRKVSMSRLRSEKDRTAKLSASAAANLANMPSFAHTISAPLAVGGPRRPPLAASGWSSSNIPTRHDAVLPSPTSLSSTSLPQILATVPLNGYPAMSSASNRNKRRSFLPIDPSPPSLNVAIPSTSPFMAATASLADVEQPYAYTSEDAMETLGDEGESFRTRPPSSVAHSDSGFSINDSDGRYLRGLESIKSYLRDLYDLGLPATEPYGGFEVIETPDATSPQGEAAALRSSVAESARSSRQTHESRGMSMFSNSEDFKSNSNGNGSAATSEPTVGKRFKDDKAKRARVLREILETEKTYVRGLSELITIYVRPASQAVNASKSNETVIPAAERKVVFGGVESVLVIHRDNFLPALQRVIQPLVDHGDDEQGELSARVAHQVGEVFRTYIAYMKQYSTYINNFDNALARMKSWTLQAAGDKPPAGSKGTIGVAAVGAGLIGSAVLPVSDAPPLTSCPFTQPQRKRVKHFLKRCKEHPQHSQINLESYLLLPVQRVPRYKLLLEDLAMCTPARDVVGPSDALDEAINSITSLASLMNEEKRESESRLRLLHWQQRITSRGPSPLVQPHRKLVLDGALTLIRVVKKSSAFVEVDTQMSLVGADGDSTITGQKAVVPVDYIKAEPMDKPIMLILCSDMLVLVQQRTGEGWEGQVDLFTVMRMATLREPASVSASNDRVLRVVDNKSIYYFNGGSHATTLQWCRAINGQNRR